MQPEPVIIEPAVSITRYVTGILRPVFDGENWIVPIIEERPGICGGSEILIADRFALSPRNLKRAAWCALTSVIVPQLANR